MVKQMEKGSALENSILASFLKINGLLSLSFATKKFYEMQLSDYCL